MELHMLYDSDRFIVVQGEIAEGQKLFEVVDKRCNMSITLYGRWAEGLVEHIRRWQETPPPQEEVEAILDAYAELAQNPLVIH